MRTTALLLPLPLVLLACGDKSGDDTASDGDATSTYETDDDGDGLSEADGDCDDADATVLPGAEELCDGIDNDCDGTIDDGAGDMLTFYMDRDEDGAGDQGSPVEACAQPEGTSDRPGDCDDLDAAVHPAAAEVCNGVDDDCDGDIDDADDSLDAATHLEFWPDADGDGYGDGAATALRACEAPADSVDNDGDCDDTNAAISPADAEVCDDAGVDEDCDGLANDADPDVYAGSQTRFYVDADGDGFGDETDAGLLACADPGDETTTYSEETGDCDDAEAARFPAAEEVCGDGIVNDCDSDEDAAFAACAWTESYTAEADATVTLTEPEDDFFTSFAVSGDIDGDGTDDLIISDHWSNNGDGWGSMYIQHGPLSAGEMDFDSDVMVDGLDSSESSGAFGAAPDVYDLDGDGYDDIVVGAPGEDLIEDNEGASYVLMGPVSSGIGPDMAALTITSTVEDAYVGVGQRFVGDQDGDGTADLLVSAAGYDTGGGHVFLLSGDMTGSADVDEDALAVISGADRYDRIGQGANMGGIVDVDGDGQHDILLGLPGVENDDGSEGSAVVFFGPVSGSLDLADAGATLVDSDTDGRLGQHVLGAFDWDGDGYDDVALGAPYRDGTVDETGRVVILAGPISDDTDAADGTLLTLDGADAESMIGGAFDVADMDGDGELDLLVGNGYLSITSNSASSANPEKGAWVLLGPASGGLTTDDAHAHLQSEDNDEGFGGIMHALGDQDGDGLPELVVGYTTGGDISVFSTPGY